MRMSRARGLFGTGEEAGFSYTGAHDVAEIETPGGKRTLVTLLKSGALRVTGGLVADVWMCGCGGTGGDGLPGVKGGDGGGGAYVAARAAMPLVSGPVTVASVPTMATMYADLTARGPSGKVGGSGGGAGAMVAGGQAAGGAGDGMDDKTPFGLAEVFAPHCGGGGGGGFDGDGTFSGRGGAGGTGGGHGGAPVYDGTSVGGAPGAGGGGSGGQATGFQHGENALQTCYGSGGGGGGAGLNLPTAGYGGKGAPGVVYLLM